MNIGASKDGSLDSINTNTIFNTIYININTILINTHRTIYNNKIQMLECLMTNNNNNNIPKFNDNDTCNE